MLEDKQYHGSGKSRSKLGYWKCGEEWAALAGSSQRRGQPHRAVRFEQTWSSWGICSELSGESVPGEGSLEQSPEVAWACVFIKWPGLCGQCGRKSWRQWQACGRCSGSGRSCRCCPVFGFYSEKMGAIGGSSASNDEIWYVWKEASSCRAEHHLSGQGRDLGPKATTVPEYGDVDHAGDNEEGEAVGLGHLVDRFPDRFHAMCDKGRRV